VKARKSYRNNFLLSNINDWTKYWIKTNKELLYTHKYRDALLVDFDKLIRGDIDTYRRICSFADLPPIPEHINAVNDTVDPDLNRSPSLIKRPDIKLPKEAYEVYKQLKDAESNQEV
jgi:hypothetical protein